MCSKFISRLPLNRAFLAVPDITAIEAWQRLARRNSPTSLPKDVPVFLAQGTADPVVWPAVTASYMQRLCRAGSSIKMIAIECGGHDLAGRDSAAEAVNWIADCFAGRLAPSDCSAPPFTAVSADRDKGKSQR